MSLHHLQIPQTHQSRFNALERQRSVVLSHMTGARLHDGDIDAAKMRYNQIVYQQWKLKSGCWIDPLVIFPPDIVAIIFQNLDGHHVDEYRVKDLLNCLNVSQLWLSRLVDLPSLWANIVIDDEAEDQLANVAICLQLSRLSPLRLIINRCTPQQWEELSPLLQPHANRIKAMEWVSLRSRWFIKQCLESLQHLPALEHIYFPRMLAFHYSTEIIPSMSLVPNLKTMSSLQMDLSQEYDLALITDVRILLPPKLGHQQYLPRNWECLRHLILNGDLKFDNSGTIFKVMDCCPYTLNSLSVSGLWVQKLPEFLERLRRHDLERLNLIITYDRSNPQSDYFLQQHDTLPVRSVDLTFVDKAGRGTELWAQWLIDMLAVSMPYIEDLLLQISSLPLAVVTSLAKLPLLRRLEIHGDILWRKASASTCLLAAVETFVYYGRQFPHDLQLPGHSLHPLSLPNLVNCTLGTRLNKDRKGRRVPPHATLLPRLSNTSLVRLHVRLPNGPTPSLRELPCLEELAMGDPLDMVTKYPVWQSNILEQLIAEPKVCRHLRKLEFYSPYAEWDILILALERRNFLGDATIRLIDEIDFKFAQPSSKLLTPISSLLAGIFVERQPLHEYSFMAIAKNFSSDSSTHSCLACLATFKGETDDGAGAGDPAFGQVDDEDGQDMESFLTSADPPLSESVCLWLAKKGSRYQTARMLIEDAEEDGKQLTRCPEHRSMKVTGSSSWHNAYLDMDEE